MGRDTTDQFSNDVQRYLHDAIDTTANAVEVVSVSVTNGAKNDDGLSEKLSACLDKSLLKLRVIEI